MIENLVNQKFGKLMVIGFAGMNSHRQSMWYCVCDCGNEITMIGSRLKNGHTRSCGCLRNEFRKLPEGVATLRSDYRIYKQNAKRKGLVFELSEEEFHHLILLDCFYCGSVPNVYNGLDRVDSSLGYSLDNVVPCCKTCNYAKNTMTYDEFRSWIMKVSDHMGAKSIHL